MERVDDSMKKMSKLFAVIVTLIYCISMMGVTVSAATHAMGKDDAKLFTENDELVAAAGDVGIKVAENGEVTVEDKLSDKTEKEQRKVADNFIDELNDSGLSVNGTNALSSALKDGYDGVEGVKIDILIIQYLFTQTQGDLAGAMKIISPFLPIINIIIGVVAILVAAALVLSTVIDLAFIGLPMVREMLMAGGEGSGGGAGSGSKPKALTYACWSTINDVESALGGGGGGNGNGKSGYKNAYGVYFKRRVWDYVLLGVCLSFLIFGGFSRFISTLLGIGDQLVG